MNKKLPGLFDCKVRPMTEEESKLFITVSLLEMKGGDTLQKLEKTFLEKQDFLYTVMTTRLEAFKKISPTLDIGIGPKIFCTLISDRPGMVVMWAHTLNELFVKQGKQVTLSDWTMKFPYGIPTEKEYERMWDLQKVIPEPGVFKTDNMVDDFKSWSLPKVQEK